jgi:hypothetical protein
VGAFDGDRRLQFHQHPHDEAAVSVQRTGLFLPHLRELQNGTPVFDDKNNRLGNSTVAARSGILQVIVSRIFMPVPSMGELTEETSQILTVGFQG